MQHRLAGRKVRHPHAVPVGRRPDAGAERLGEGLLGGEALGEVGGRLAVGAEAPQLGLAQDALGEAIAEALERLLDAADLDHVVADAVDQPAASVISRFISRTALRRPTNSARLTMAWPMCSSRTPGSAATGLTLK